jgi:hypothetical protein
MPTYVSRYQYDVFVSYAHVDNQPLPGTGEGWVTEFIAALKTRLGQKLGRADAYSLWMDPQLKGHAPLTGELVAKVQNSATLVMLLSPGYLHSEWCQRECSLFLEVAPPDSGRLFIVELEPVDERPAALQHLVGYRFWTLNAANKPRLLGVPTRNDLYYQRLFDVADQLVDHLKELRQQSAPALVPVTAPGATTAEQPAREVVFLAEVPDDLQDARTEVEQYLAQYGYKTLPDPDTLPYVFPNAEQLQTALQQDLQQAMLFVQLLNSTNPRRRPGMNTPQLQYTAASAMASTTALPILQWRAPQLDLSTIADPAHRSLLDAATVVAMGLEEFKQYILRQLQALDEQKRQQEARRQAEEARLQAEEARRQAALSVPLSVPGIEHGTVVFVNTSPDDLEYAQEIFGMLSAEGVDPILPLFAASKPEEVREDLENNLLECDALIVLYASTSVVWVRNQLRYYLRVYKRRKQPLKSLVLFTRSSPDKPPLGTPPLGVPITNMQVLEFSTLQESSCVSAFLRMLQP